MTDQEPKEYTKRLGEGARKRIRIRREGQKILDYMVQLEVYVEEDEVWKEVVRYDPADRGPHCDIHRLNGDEKDEDYIFPFDINTGYKEALQQGDDDVERNWERYLRRFLQGKWPK